MDGCGFVGLVAQGDRAGDGFKITETDFDGDSLCVSIVFAQSGGDILRLAGDQRVELFDVV